MAIAAGNSNAGLSALVGLASGKGVAGRVGLFIGDGASVGILVGVGAWVGVEVAVLAGSSVGVGVVKTARTRVAVGSGVGFESAKDNWLKRQASNTKVRNKKARVGCMQNETRYIIRMSLPSPITRPIISWAS